MAEYRRLLKAASVEVLEPRDIGLELTVVEDGVTFLANAQKKAREYASASGLPVLADDSGIAVKALGGRPGVDSAVFGGPGLDDAGRVRLLLETLGPEADRRARYVCVICLAAPSEPVRDVFVGHCDGRIGRVPKGDGGFGYDPIFVLPDGRTMAEVDDEEKDFLSHRGQAVREMLATFDLAGWAGRHRPQVASNP